MTVEERREALAKVLRTHREDAAYPDTCICETAAPVNAPEGRHAAHVADALAPLVEEWIAEDSKVAARVAQEGGYAEGYEAGAAAVVARVEAVWPDPWCRREDCRWRRWRSGSVPTHRRGDDCPPPSCPTCDGVGERYADHPTGDPALQQRDTCRDCNGTGEGR